jgi:hypothetical protein
VPEYSRDCFRLICTTSRAVRTVGETPQALLSRPACIEVSLRRGFVRLGIGLAVLWFVFWTCAYVMRPLASENAQPLPALSPTTDIALIAVVIVGLPWIVSGFRSN